MNNTYRRLGLLISVALFSYPIFLAAAACPYPPEVTTYVGCKAPLGSGALKLLLFKVYDIAFWSQSNQFNWETPFVLRVTYARNFSSKLLVNTSINQMEKIESIDVALREEYRKILSGIFPDVHAGDSITAVYLPGKSLLFFYNGKQIGAIVNMRLARLYMNMWLAPNASYPALRKKILNE